MEVEEEVEEEEEAEEEEEQRRPKQHATLGQPLTKAISNRAILFIKYLEGKKVLNTHKRSICKKTKCQKTLNRHSRKAGADCRRCSLEVSPAVHSKKLHDV